MPDCCDPGPYRHIFNSKEAKRNLRNYRKKGLGPMSAGMVDFLVSQDVAGLDMLEVGGGIGAIEIELLKAGVTSAVNVELSAGYNDAALWLKRRVLPIRSSERSVTSLRHRARSTWRTLLSSTQWSAAIPGWRK